MASASGIRPSQKQKRKQLQKKKTIMSFLR